MKMKIQQGISSLYHGAPWLTTVGLIMLADIVVSLVGLAADPAVVTGAPAWLKPLKFGMSTALYCFNTAYFLGLFTRLRRVAGLIEKPIAAALLLEIVLIDMQAARHTTSHFNLGTPFDSGVFAVMGMGIGIVMLSNIALAAVSFFEPFSNRAWAWTVRLSFLMILAGMSTGALMSLPTPEQLAAAHGHRLTVNGAHTVGAPDGGPGLPLAGWSADHGDLRIAHFVGLHGMTVLTLLLWGMQRKGWTIHRQWRGVLLCAGSYSVIFALVLWQALRGQPLLRPDGLTWNAWEAWAAITFTLAVATLGRRAAHEARPFGMKANS